MSDSKVVIYGPTISTFVRIVAITAEEKGLDWEVIPTPARSAKQRERHPFQRAPAVDIDGVKLFETDAITRYIDEAFDGPSLQPDTARKRAEMQKWMSVMQHYYFPTTEIGLVSPRILAPMQGVAVDEELVQRAIPTISYQMAVADAHLSENAFFAAEQPSLADYYQQVCWWAVWLTPEGRSLIHQYSHLKRWLGFMMSRSSAKQTAWPNDSAAEQALMN